MTPEVIQQIQDFVNLLQWGAYAAIGGFVLSLANFVTLWQLRGRWQRSEAELKRSELEAATLRAHMAHLLNPSSQVPS